MSIKLTDTQLVLLGAAAQRKDLCLVAPPTLKGATAQKVARKLAEDREILEAYAEALRSRPSGAANGIFVPDDSEGSNPDG